MGILLVVAAALPLLLARIATLPLLDPDEAKHAQIAREMLQAGRWIEPLVYGQPYHHKPSLLYLLIGLCYRVVGVGELGARIVPAAAGLLAVVATYLAASRERTTDGLLAALLLLASPLFFAVARFTNFDGLLTLVSLAAILVAARWVDDPFGPAATRRLVAFAALAGLGVLVKGPAAAVLLVAPLVAVGFHALRATSVRTLAGAGIAFSLVVGAWLVPALLLHPGYVYDFLWVHNVQRYSVDADMFHPEPFWYFLPVLLVTLLPWSLLVPPAIVAGWKRGPGHRLLAVYAVWVIAFFSASSGKLATYVLPAFPALAVLVATWLGELDARGEPRARSWLTGAAALLYLVLPPAVYFVVRHEEPGFEWAAIGLVTLPLVGIAALWSRRPVLRTERGAVAVLAVGMLATYAVVLAWFSPVIGEFTSDRDLVAELRRRGPPPDRVVVHKVRPFSFLFYSGWPIVYKVSEDEYRAALTEPGRVYVLTKPSRRATLLPVDPPLALHEIAGNHRRMVLERVDSPSSRQGTGGDSRLP
jgi:4-amino-4-deoxy-L-arabinose transferase-like glycosyltransferase